MKRVIIGAIDLTGYVARVEKTPAVAVVLTKNGFNYDIRLKAKKALPLEIVLSLSAMSKLPVPPPIFLEWKKGEFAATSLHKVYFKDKLINLVLKGSFMDSIYGIGEAIAPAISRFGVQMDAFARSLSQVGGIPPHLLQDEPIVWRRDRTFEEEEIARNYVVGIDVGAEYDVTNTAFAELDAEGRVTRIEPVYRRGVYIRRRDNAE